MANTKVWLGQWQCVLQEGDPTPSTTPCNLLPSQGPLFSRAELDQLGNLGTLQIWGKFLTSAASEFTSCHWRRTTELCASVGSICPESQSTSVNTNPFQQTRSNPARLLGFSAKQLLLHFSVSGKLLQKSKWENPGQRHTRAWCNHHTLPSPAKIHRPGGLR